MGIEVFLPPGTASLLRPRQAVDFLDSLSLNVAEKTWQIFVRLGAAPVSVLLGGRCSTDLPTYSNGSRPRLVPRRHAPAPRRRPHKYGNRPEPVAQKKTGPSRGPV